MTDEVTERERDIATPTCATFCAPGSRRLLFPEHSTWATVVEEDVKIALSRCAVLARDEHQKDDSKSVQQYYSERLASLLKEAEVEFDPQYMLKA